MSKVDLRARASTSLFANPLPYDDKAGRETIILVSEFDGDGNSITSHVSVEQKMSEQIPLNYQDVNLSNLVSKGVDPHALDMIDTQKLGADAGVAQLTNHIINKADDFFETSKSE